MKFKMLAAAAAAFMTFGVGEALAGRDLDQIRQRGTLRCGVQGPSNPGFGVPDSQGRWGGFNVEVCRAIAITILNDATKVEFVPVTTQSRFPALSAGEVDVLSNNTTWTLTRDTNVNRFNFPAITFYEGQAIMVPRRLTVTSARQLNGATVCVQPGTTTELNIADFFRANNLRFTPVVIADLDEIRRAYDSGRCDVFTNDFAALAAQIASKSAATVAIGKETFYRQLELPMAEAYAEAAAVMVRNMLYADAKEGIGAFIEKRRAVWKGC